MALPALALAHPLPRTMTGLAPSVSGAAAALRAHTAPGARVLTPVPYLAAQAGRDVVPGTEMGMFSLTDSVDPPTASRLHLMTPSSLLATVNGGAADAVALVAFQTPWNLGWSVPTLRPVDPALTATLFRSIGRHYRRVYQDPLFVVFVRR